MFLNNGMPQQRGPVVYVIMQGQGQNGEANPSNPSQQMIPSHLQQQQYPHQVHGQQQVRYRPPSASPVDALQRQPSQQPHPLAVHSSSSAHYGSSSPGRNHQRRESNARRDYGSSRTSYQASQQPQALPPGASPPYAAATPHEGGLQLFSIPQYASQGRGGGSTHHQVAFPPPGATIQSIQTVPPQHAQQVAMASTFSQSHHDSQPYYMAAAGQFVPSHQQQQQQQQHHQPAVHNMPPNVTQVTNPSSQLFDPNIKFLHAPPGVTIPPQSFPSYQLVPAGYQVVPVTNGKNPSETVNKGATSTAEARVAAEQAMDQENDEETLLNEPIVLSGTPYSYPVNIGKDVVSGKGGRAQQYNKHFRTLITDAFPRYNKTASKIEKREIGIRIYLTIVKSGGRFLDAQGNPMNRSKAILKVMKALKDAKTWANDARRLASKKRKVEKQLEVMNAAEEESQEKDHEGEGAKEKSEERPAKRPMTHVEAVDDGIDESDEETIDEDDLSDEELLATYKLEKIVASAEANLKIPSKIISKDNEPAQGGSPALCKPNKERPVKDHEPAQVVSPAPCKPNKERPVKDHELAQGVSPAPCKPEKERPVKDHEPAQVALPTPAKPDKEPAVKDRKTAQNASSISPKSDKEPAVKDHKPVQDSSPTPPIPHKQHPVKDHKPAQDASPTPLKPDMESPAMDHESAQDPPPAHKASQRPVKGVKSAEEGSEACPRPDKILQRPVNDHNLSQERLPALPRQDKMPDPPGQDRESSREDSLAPSEPGKEPKPSQVLAQAKPESPSRSGVPPRPRKAETSEV